VAGLAAAAALRAAGRDCVVIEAAGRVGGRAYTSVPPELGGAWLDHGATWLHDADRNPLAEMARAAGETVIDADAARCRRLMVDGREASPAEAAEYRAAWDEFERVVGGRADREPDIAFATAMAPMRANPWAATIQLWEANQIAAADPAIFSLHDWRKNALNGRNLQIEGGIGSFVARRMGAMAGAVERDTPAVRISWGDGVAVATPRGTVRARAAIVTVSTGVLAGMDFSPALPRHVRDAIAGLPMGLLTKVAVPALGADRLGLPQGLSIQRRAAPGEHATSFTAWPLGKPYLHCFIGGPAAWALAREGAAATADFVLGQIAAVLGSDALKGLGVPFVTEWGTDPLHRGGYAFATVGNAGARGVLGTPLDGGRLAFAGEAVCTDGLAGTVAGACLSGRAAALGVMAAVK
jgi:monoamine oxidase